ncbi:MAG: peptidylprolyl isomerase [Helicobacteraceae bacterium]|nr:peptidylprolyl isomerase [Helicobacteraceae bacterium]
MKYIYLTLFFLTNLYSSKLSYVKDIQPILDKRCVVCHSCYNSPCQAKFSSFEGVSRGGSKIVVYDAFRLRAIDPTRLFIDADSTSEWRKKGFFSLTKNRDNSIMAQLLNDKQKNPKVVGKYTPELDELICPKNDDEMYKYFKEKPNHGMPYGFPEISKSEHKTLTKWLNAGAFGATKDEQKLLTTPTKIASEKIKKYEQFLNKKDAKHVVSARYLYEHLFLAHINFELSSNEFFELVRSSTPSPKPINVIATVRPFDKPTSKKFYYRFRKIHSTIVDKTHIVFTLDEKKFNYINELFIKPQWNVKPYIASYDIKTSANPFITYSQIPALSRYKFLLDNSKYIIETFIKGPVCRGQIALNVIHDHFWMMFLDPEYDLSLRDNSFINSQIKNLSLPIEYSNQSIFKTFSNEYQNRAQKYMNAKYELYNKAYPNGLGVESIWSGNNTLASPIVTVYRHFDSATVLRGVEGNLARTMWVIDYPLLERIYYALVAGYDVFGNVSEQTNIRRYMDFLRFEGEQNFISYMPKEKRLNIYKSWYIGDKKVQKLKTLKILNHGDTIKYSNSDPKEQFMQSFVNDRILKGSNIEFDNIDYLQDKAVTPAKFSHSKEMENIYYKMRQVTKVGSGFVKYITSNKVNNAVILVKMPNERDYVFSLLINRWHNNVNSMFKESSTFVPSKNRINFVDGSVGSYPNAFGVLKYEDLNDFFDMLENYDGSKKYTQKVKKYFISRSDKNFWNVYDWFQKDFIDSKPVKSGLYDLNRYHEKAW